MGTKSAVELDAWLRDGGLVVTSNDRAARAIASSFHRSRRIEGLTAWPVPNVVDWHTFTSSAWNTCGRDGRLLLSRPQERTIWAGIIEASGNSAALLPGPRHRLAAMAMDAHDLICSYAPRFLRAASRGAWQQDAAQFSSWLSAFDDTCRAGSVLSVSRLPQELIPLLQTDSSTRPPLLLLGFDRMFPAQKELFNAWGDWRELALDAVAGDVHFYTAADASTELAACAQWCRDLLDSVPGKRILVIAQDAASRRGEIERAFSKFLKPSSSMRFEFSLGIPLSQMPLPCSAQLLLRWLTTTLEEHEVDWLISTSHVAAHPHESAMLQALMRALRRRGLERVEWPLTVFANQRVGGQLPPVGWVRRMIEAKRLIEQSGHTHRSPLDWAGLVPKILEAAGWPGYRALSSAEYQAAQRWQHSVDLCGSLAFNGRQMDWKSFLSELDFMVAETLFTLESNDAPILIVGPAESAGLTTDAIWFLGAGEDAWPTRGAMHPLLPVDVQREVGMPHATSQLDWELARSITARIVASASEVRFSCALQDNGVETRSSRLVALFAGPPQPIPASLTPEPGLPPLTIPFADSSRIPLSATTSSAGPALGDDFDAYQNEAGDVATRSILGGSTVLTSQSQCPFKAFATARLAAQTWRPAETGLTASMRGLLLHSVMHSIWSGPPAGIRSLGQLRALTDRRSFVEGHVQTVLRNEMPDAAREQMPHRYLELEERRLTRLLTEWLNYEVTRQPFEVLSTEDKAKVSIEGLTLHLRLDRIDRLNDGSLLVIDYKTGNVSPSSWEPPRPDDVQLPLYATSALPADESVGGLVFAKVRAGDQSFAGRVGDACATLIDDLSPQSALIKDPLGAEDLVAWREIIEQLTRDFLSGQADVDPREYPATCKHCGLQTVCRIQENHELSDEDDAETPEKDDE